MGSGESLHAVETVILLLLVLVAAFAAMARRLKVPYPIVLVLAGLVISFVPRMPRVPLDPNIVFVIFLPPLLFASAWAMSWREFRRNAVVIGLLAVGLVGFTVWGVAEFSDRFITALDWKAGFLLGAVISTTDATESSPAPVAASRSPNVPAPLHETVTVPPDWLIESVGPAAGKLLITAINSSAKVMSELVPPCWKSFAQTRLSPFTRLVGLTLIGALTAGILGRAVHGLLEAILNRLPIIRSLYIDQVRF